MMKNRPYRFVLLFLLPAVLLFSCSEERTPENFGKEILSYFEDDNAVAYKQAFISKNEIFAVVDDSKLSPELKKEASLHLKLRSRIWKNVSKLAFEGMRYDAFKRGVNWQDIEVTGVTISEGNLDFFGLRGGFISESGITCKDIRVKFTSAGDAYILELENCIETPNGWKLTRNAEIKKDYSSEE